MGRRRSIFSERSVKEIEKRYGKYALLVYILYFVFMACVVSVVNGIFSNKNGFIWAGVIIGIISIVGVIICRVRAIKDEETREIVRQTEIKRQEDIRLQKIQSENNLLSRASMAEIDKMNGETFERFVGLLYQKMGYDTHQTKASGDYGVDIVAGKGYEKLIIQTKRYTNKVGISAVQEISAARNYYSVSRAAIVTNNTFTEPAQNLAKANGIALVDRLTLAKLIIQYMPDTGVTAADIPENKEKYVPEPQPYSREDTSFVPLLKIGDYTKESYSHYLYKNFDIFDQYLRDYKIDEAYKFIKRIMLVDHPDKTWFELHFFLLRLIDRMYYFRKDYPQAIEYTVDFCKLDIENFPNYIKERGTDCLQNCTSPSFQKIITIYEKRGDLETALHYCDLAIQYKIIDTNNCFYNIRKQKLLKKQEKLTRSSPQ